MVAEEPAAEEVLDLDVVAEEPAAEEVLDLDAVAEEPADDGQPPAGSGGEDDLQSFFKNLGN